MHILPPWTFTQLKDFENCPHKYFRKYVLKDLPREKETPELRHGIDTHNTMERAIKYNQELPPGTPVVAQKLIDQWRPFKPQAEVKVGINRDGQAVDFFAKDVFGRGKVDVLIVGDEFGAIADWKTGNVYEDDFELEVFAFFLSRLLQHVKRWTGLYVWLKENRLGPQHTLNPAKGQERIAKIWDTIERCNVAGNWPTNDNPLCGWCPVKSCHFNRNTRA